MPSKCQFPECTKHASFGPPGKNIILYCATHKEPDMVTGREEKRMHTSRTYK